MAQIALYETRIYMIERDTDDLEALTHETVCEWFEATDFAEAEGAWLYDVLIDRVENCMDGAVLLDAVQFEASDNALSAYCKEHARTTSDK